MPSSVMWFLPSSCAFDILYTFVISPMCAVCPAHLIFITLIISVKTVNYTAHHIIQSTHIRWIFSWILSILLSILIVKIVHFEWLLLNIAVEWVAFELHILDILGSDLGQDLSYPDQNFT
jgi:hypothetical protein